MTADNLGTLEKFICDKDLKDLEQKFNRFNIFDCLKLSRAEIRHSNFLAWLLDPKETHGLGDYFLKEFLIAILKNHKNAIKEIHGKKLKLENINADTEEKERIEETYYYPSIFDIDCWSMENIEIHRELEYIDLLLVDEVNRFVLVIENKIDSFQHDNQLARYRQLVDERYPNESYKKMFIYLKPQKEKVENPYLYVSYKTVKEVVEEMKRAKSNNLNDDIIMALNHYLQIIERDFMEKDEVREICVNLYKKHRKAIELITSYGNPQKAIFELLKDVVEDCSDLRITDIENERAILCMPVNANTNLGFATLKFGNIQGKFDFVWFELIINSVESDNDKLKRDKFISKLNIKLYEKKGILYSTEKPKIITLEEYEKNSIQEVKALIAKRINEQKEKFIDAFTNAINEIY